MLKRKNKRNNSNEREIIKQIILSSLIDKVELECFRKMRRQSWNNRCVNTIIIKLIILRQTISSKRIKQVNIINRTFFSSWCFQCYLVMWVDSIPQYFCLKTYEIFKKFNFRLFSSLMDSSSTTSLFYFFLSEFLLSLLSILKWVFCKRISLLICWIIKLQ